jgi:glycosyltransferase involved in cell wall biosynthesis
MQPLHVLHILNSAHGGSAISTFELIDELKKLGVTSSVVCFNNADAVQQERIKALVDGRVIFIPLYWMNKRIRAATWKRPLIELKSLFETWGGYKYQRLIEKFIRQQGVNIIHTGTIVNPEGAIAAARSRLPHVWHVRELIGRNKHFQFYDYPRWAAYVSKNSYVLVANSTVTKECLLEFFDATKIETIPNGINIQKFSVKEHVQKPTLVVGMVGSVTSKWKNHRFFLETAAILKYPDFEFRIYGSLPDDRDEYYAGLKHYIEKNKIVNVRFMGFSNNPSEIMKEIDVLFHPTHLESFGRIFVEAMAGGVPVVAIDQGGALEMIRHNENGFLIPLGDRAAAAAHLERLRSDVILRIAIGEKARKIVEAEYSLHVLGTRIKKLYQRALS